MLLFEYGQQKVIHDRKTLEQSLLDLWERREAANFLGESDENEMRDRYQPFLSFDGDKIRANNYVGFIQNENDVVEIFPKVFRNLPDAPNRRDLMLRHIFYWFGYCRKWQFPISRTSLDSLDIDSFPELIINLIANQFLDSVSTNPFSMYQPIEAALEMPRGSINFKRYISSSLAKGNLHRIECDYEPFLFDNKVNRIIKYCSRVLLNRTRFAENMRLFQEVIFILSDVEDTVFSAHDLDGISINSFFSDYVSILDSCKIILNQQLYSSNSYELSQWCLLFPMEYIFEDFLAGFLDEHFSDKWQVEYQKSDMFVSNEPRAFLMQHDIFLSSLDYPGRQIIVDAKYKLRDRAFKSDAKKGISQPDLYQMISYALKRGCEEVLLIYPNTSETLKEADIFEIRSGFNGNEKIRVTAIEIPFWSFDNFCGLEHALRNTLERTLGSRGS